MGQRRGRMLMVVALAAVGALGLAACGDDSDGGGDVEAYCELNEELNAQDDVPTDEQLDEIVSAAPDEIKDAANTLADFIRDNRDDIFNAEPTDEVNEALDQLDEFDVAECGETADGSGDGDEAGTTDE